MHWQGKYLYCPNILDAEEKRGDVLLWKAEPKRDILAKSIFAVEQVCAAKVTCSHSFAR